jgi:hypothetical protein
VTAAVLVSVALLQLLLAVIGTVTLAWLASPSSPCRPVAGLWRRLIVVTMLPAPGGAS